MDNYQKICVALLVASVLAVIFLLPASAFFGKQKPAQSHVIEVNEKTFPTEVLKSEIPVFVDFYADWCGPCRKQAPVVEQMAKKYHGKIKFVKINVDTSHQLCDEYNVTSIPTLMLIDPKNGSSFTSFGFHDFDQLQSFIKTGLRH